MDGLVNLPFFFIASIIIIIAPGPDFIYVTTRGVSQGKRAGTLSALGTSVGLLIHTLLAALLQAAPQPTMSVTSGTIELKTHVMQKQKTQGVTGSLALA
ncbi:MAG: LysE family transporter, partial [Thermodesulfobacteriota bacterium]